MGRKIPGKKHRGIKDPAKQQAQRMQRLKGKINAPPTDPDEQPVPKSLIRLFALDKQYSDSKTKAKAKKRKHPSLEARSTEGNANNPLQRLSRFHGEDGRAFSLRISSAARTLLHPPRHYPGLDEIEEDEDTKGQRMTDLRERRRKRVARAQGKGPTKAETKLVQKQERERAAREAAAAAARDAVAEEASRVHYERVPFGEVAHEPPTLRRAVSRPGTRPLLLKSLLGAQSGPGVRPSAVERERRELARLDAVTAYRALKLEQKKNSNKTKRNYC